MKWKYIVSLLFLVIGITIALLRDKYQNLILSLFCDTLYKFGSNPMCDQLLNTPDFFWVSILFGIFGLIISAYIDLTKHSG